MANKHFPNTFDSYEQYIACVNCIGKAKLGDEAWVYTSNNKHADIKPTNTTAITYVAGIRCDNNSTNKLDYVLLLGGDTGQGGLYSMETSYLLQDYGWIIPPIAKPYRYYR